MQENSPFTERLKEARKKMKISQKNLGIKIGVDESSASSRMNQYEKGVHMPDFATLQKMAKVLNVPVSYFFCDSEVMAKLVCLIDGLDEDAKRKLASDLENK